MVRIQSFGSSSLGNCYLLQDGDSKLLLDAGVNPTKMRIDFSTVDALLVTHEHNDHSAFIEAILRRGALSAYMTEGTAQFVKAPSYRIMHVQSQRQFTVKNWTILPFDIQHDAAEPCGYFIQTPSGKRVLFATDTYYIKYQFPKMTHIMIECNYSLEDIRSNFNSGQIDGGRYKRVMNSHFELKNVIQFLKSNDLSALEEVHLLHLSDSNSNAEVFKREIQKATGVPVYVAGGG